MVFTNYLWFSDWGMVQMTLLYPQKSPKIHGIPACIQKVKNPWQRVGDWSVRNGGELQLERHRNCLIELQFIQQLPPENRSLALGHQSWEGFSEEK